MRPPRPTLRPRPMLRARPRPEAAPGADASAGAAADANAAPAATPGAAAPDGAAATPPEAAPEPPAPPVEYAALTDVNQALAIAPDDPVALRVRGDIYKAMGKTDEAIADYRRALELDPFQSESRDALVKLDQEVPPGTGAASGAAGRGLGDQGAVARPLRRQQREISEGPGRARDVRCGQAQDPRMELDEGLALRHRPACATTPAVSATAPIRTSSTRRSSTSGPTRSSPSSPIAGARTKPSGTGRPIPWWSPTRTARANEIKLQTAEAEAGRARRGRRLLQLALGRPGGGGQSRPRRGGGGGGRRAVRLVPVALDDPVPGERS